MVNVKGDRLIPCEALWPIMEDFKRQFESTQPAEDSRRNLYASGGTGQNHEAAWIICLSEISNVSPRRIRGILSGGMDGRDTISFSMADQLVVAMEDGSSWIWRPELAEHYHDLPVLIHEIREGRELPDGFSPTNPWQERQLKKHGYTLVPRAA